MNRNYAVGKGTRPFTHIAIDLFYLPTSEEGYRYVVIAMDSFTKWPEASPLIERSSTSLAKWLHENIVCRYGCPSVIRTDNGGEFLGIFHQYCIDNGITHVVGSPYHP